MKFISWNVNGLRACVTKGFQDYFNDIDADFFFNILSTSFFACIYKMSAANFEIIINGMLARFVFKKSL